MNGRNIGRGDVMGIEVSKWWYLIVYVFLVGITFYITKDYKANKIKKYVTLTIRCLFLLCLILSLMEPKIIKKVKETTTVFLTDASASMGNAKQVDEFISDAIKNKTDNDNVASVIFGKNAYIDTPINKEKIYSIDESKVKREYTDIEQGMLKSIALFNQNTNKRIVLLTDAKENRGDINKLTRCLRQQDIDFKVKFIDSEFKDEVYIDSFDIPKKVKFNQIFEIATNIYSTVATTAQVIISSDGHNKLTETVKLTKGANRYVFKDFSEKQGFSNYEMLIRPSKDTITLNNNSYAYTYVDDVPRVLLVYDNDKDAVQMRNILESSSLNYDVVKSNMVPTKLNNMLRYKSIILANVSAINLNDDFLNYLEPYVKDFGGGLVVIGGENTYALGGYYKTPLEKVLPVNMHMSGIKNKPKIAMMLILDKSGSMAGYNLKLSKEAAIRTIDIMDESDQIGVISFDSEAHTVVELQDLKDKSNIEESIVQISEGGGTSILPALKEGYQTLVNSDAQIKHIIILTDGQAENSGYAQTINDMNLENITLSTVGVGESADYSLLERLAYQAGGRFYKALDGSSIPRIFTKETFLAAREYINNITFTPRMSYHELIDKVYSTGLPELHGYIGTSIKDSATTVLSSNMNDPILATWQYGLGKTVAWTSDLSGEWSKEYSKWSNNNDFWHDIVQYTIENYSNNQVTVESTNNNGKVEVIVNTTDKDLTDTVVQAMLPNNKSVRVELEPVRKGVYKGSFEHIGPGPYMIKAIQRLEGKVISTGQDGIIIPYSEEYKIATKDKFMRFINKIQADVIDTPDQVFANKSINSVSKYDCSHVLLIIAIVMWIIDIAIRRLNILNKLIEMFHKLNIKLSAKAKSKVATIENDTNINIRSKNDNKNNNNKNNKKNKNNQSKQEKTLNTSELLSSVKKYREGE